MECLRQAIRLPHRDFLAGNDPARELDRACQAIQDVERADVEDAPFTICAAVYEQRVALSALLQAAGLYQDEANRKAGLRGEV